MKNYGDDNIRYVFGSRKKTLFAYLLVATLSIYGLWLNSNEISYARQQFDLEHRHDVMLSTARCEAANARAVADSKYNLKLLAAERLYASAIDDTEINAERKLEAHHMRIDAYTERAKVSTDLANIALKTCK